jgi:hypothetical protein
MCRWPGRPGLRWHCVFFVGGGFGLPPGFLPRRLQRSAAWTWWQFIAGKRAFIVTGGSVFGGFRVLSLILTPPTRTRAHAHARYRGSDMRENCFFLSLSQPHQPTKTGLSHTSHHPLTQAPDNVTQYHSHQPDPGGGWRSGGKRAPGPRVTTRPARTRADWPCHG